MAHSRACAGAMMAERQEKEEGMDTFIKEAMQQDEPSSVYVIFDDDEQGEMHKITVYPLEGGEYSVVFKAQGHRWELARGSDPEKVLADIDKELCGKSLVIVE